MALARWNGVVQDAEGNAVSGAQIEVRNEATGGLAPLYSDRDGTVGLGNPYVASGPDIAFHARGGNYRITASKGTELKTWRWVAIGTSQGVDVEDLIVGLQAGIITAQTLAELDANAPETPDPGITPAPRGGVVWNDPNPALNGYYTYNYAATEWEYARPLPDTFAKVLLSGTGTAQTGVLAAGVSPAGIEVFFAKVVVPNTGAMTLSINGGPARQVVNLAGNSLSAGEWTGMVMFYLNEDGQYQLLIDAGAAASAAQSASDANEARILAEAALADINEKWLGAHTDDAEATAAAGGSPIVGAEYWNTTLGKRKTWDGAVWQENDVALNDGAVTEPKLADGAVSERALAPEAVTIEKVAAAVLARMDASRPSQGRARVDYWTTSAIAAFVPAALAMNGFRMFGNNYKYGQPVFSTGGAGRKVVSIIDNVAYENIATKLNWYALFAVANEGDATCSFVLAPFLRVYSVAGNVVTLGGGAANQNASPVTKTYDMNNDVLAGTDCLIINQGANWSGRVTTVTANTDSTVTLDDATGLVQLNFLLPAPPGWDHYVYLGSVYHENGSSAIGGDFRNIADSGSKVTSRMVNAGEYPTGGTVSPVKVRLGGEIPPLAAGVICSPGGTLSTSSSGSVAVQLWHDGNNHDVFRMLAVKEGASNLGFNAMAEVTFSKEQAFHVAFSGTLASQIASGSCLIYGWIEP